MQQLNGFTKEARRDGTGDNVYGSSFAEIQICQTKKYTSAICMAVVALLMICILVLGAGCSSEGSTEDNFLVIDLGEHGVTGISTDMGASPAGKTTVTLSPAEGALESYQSKMDTNATVEDMLQAWIDAEKTVKLGDKELAQKSFDEWKHELESPQNDVDRLLYYDLSLQNETITLTLPAALFDMSLDDAITTKHLNIEANDFDNVSGDVSLRTEAATSLVVRVLDKSAEMGGEIQYEYEFSDEDLKSLPVTTGYESSANCGMAGLRSFYAEGVYLTDLLDAAGVDFGSGMTIQMRTLDYVEETDSDDVQSTASYYPNGTFTYEELMDVPRYHYPAMWDDVTTYDELGGATVYELLSTDMNSWKGDDEQSKALARIIGESKVEVSPFLSWTNNVGVVAWGGTDPATQTYGEYKINPYSEYSRYSFHYGMKATEDGSIEDEATTMHNSGMVFGIDIFPTAE